MFNRFILSFDESKPETAPMHTRLHSGPIDLWRRNEWEWTKFFSNDGCEFQTLFVRVKSTLCKNLCIIIPFSEWANCDGIEETLTGSTILIILIKIVSSVYECTRCRDIVTCVSCVVRGMVAACKDIHYINWEFHQVFLSHTFFLARKLVRNVVLDDISRIPT